MSKVGRNIRQLRTEKGLTQEQLAQQLHLTRQAVSSYETGRSSPDIDLLPEIARLLDTDVNTLIYGPSPKPRDSRREWLVMTGLLLLCYPLKVCYTGWAADYIRRFLLVWPQFLWFSLLPLFYLGVGRFVMVTLNLLFPRVKPLHSRRAFQVKVCILGLLCLWLCCGLALTAQNAYMGWQAHQAQLAEQAFSSEQARPLWPGWAQPFLNRAFDVVISPFYYPGRRLTVRGLFLGLGAALWFLRRDK